jgi:hypothetical protein
MNNGFVYFIQDEETGNIDISSSRYNHEERLKDFQTGNSNELTLLGYIEGTLKEQFILYQEFSEERIWNDDYWFESSPRLKERIKELLEESLEDKKGGIGILNKEYEDIVEVEYNDGKYNGYGTYTIPSGIMYIGEFKNGLPNGQGTETFLDGKKYVGEFRDGKKHGQGTETYPDVQKNKPSGSNMRMMRLKVYKQYSQYEGEWKNGKQIGQGTTTWNDGSKFVGSTNEHGQWVNGIYYDKDGNITGKRVNGTSIKP